MAGEIKVLDHGFVRLDGCLADDLSVINSARVSFHKRHERVEEGDDKLIAFLMKHRHGTPFEHNCFRFHVKAPIFVVREWQRHRIGSYNEWSARYSTLEPEFYLPNHVREQVGRPGAYTYEITDDEAAVTQFRGDLKWLYSEAYGLYEKFMLDGVAREQARLVLPLAIYTEMYWTVNARSLMNFLSLRNHESAMWEIRQYAEQIEYLFRVRMPITAEAFIENGRVAP